MDDAGSGLEQSFAYQVAAAEAFGSPFAAASLRIMLGDIQAGGPFARLTQAWRAESTRALIKAAAPLRLLGGLHYLALSDLAPGLAAEFPAARPRTDPVALGREIVGAGEAHGDILSKFAASPPQTNEVRRSIGLLGGFLTVAQRTGAPLRCLEIGASAGLNLNWDRYFYDLGGLGRWGDPDSPLRLETDWGGGPPPLLGAARVAERAGCDRAPLDLSDPDQALRLQAYVWADQSDRLARLRAAITIARRHPPPVEIADAAVWAERMTAPRTGMATVLYHSVVWFYLGTETQGAIQAAIRRAAAAANAQAPFAWLRMEPQSADPGALMGLRLTLWPGGVDRMLASVHPHGACVSWASA
jgi:hypothetical protein